MTNMRVYLAGPMTNLPHWGFDQFDRVKEDYLALGYKVVSPADHDRELGFEGLGLNGTVDELERFNFDLPGALLWDLEQIASCMGVVLLRGWEHSKGARVELAFAAAIGKLVQYEGEHEWRSAADVFLHHWVE